VHRRRTVSRLLLLGAAALGAACTTGSAPEPPAPDQPLAGRCGGQQPFVATGTEPGWRLTLSAAGLDLQADYGTRRVNLPAPQAQQQDGTVVFRAAGDGHRVAVTVGDRYCTNAMSGKPFPCTVNVTLNGEGFDGCGGDPASLLIGPAWQVISLAGASLPADSQQPTLQFAADGTVTGTDGCNRFHGRYAITGIGVRFDGLASTRMACAGQQAVATALYRTLEAVQLFRLDDGRLILASHGEARLTAQR